MNSMIIKTISAALLSIGSVVSYNNRPQSISLSSSSSSSLSSSSLLLSTMSNSISQPSSSIVDNLLKEQNIDPNNNNNKGSLLLRKVEVFAIATRLFLDYKLVSWRCNQITDNDQLVDEIWDCAHERNAKYLFKSFSKLQALWIKLGQYISSRADVMPKPYLEELSKCQDFAETKMTIESEFGKPLESIFLSIEKEPIAVASIASVHRARLLNGKEVVIKVQHQNVGEKLLLDLKCLEAIGDMVRYLEPDFDMSPVIREWAKEVPKELDFKRECDNQKMIQNSLNVHYRQKPLNIDVTIPNIVDGLVTEKCLVMDYVDGFKIDKTALDSLKIDKDIVLMHITRAYGKMIFSDGKFQADNHPGNLLIDSRTHEPVLLDFGLTKELEKDTQKNLAKFLVACDVQDIQGILDSLDKIGLKFRSDSFDIQLLSKYFFRDMKPSDEAKEENKQRRKDYNEQQEARRTNFYAGDSIDVSSRNMIGIRTTKKGVILKVLENDIINVKFTNEEEGFVKKASCKLQKSRSIIEAWPDTFIFFERVLNLLRGLSALLDARASYFDNMLPFAQECLTSPLSYVGNDINGVDRLGLTDMMKDMINNKEILGAQICVIKNNVEVSNFACGCKDPYERLPMKLNTITNCFSVTKAISASAILLMAEDKLIDINKPIAFYWPEFSKNGKENIKIIDVLNHTSGLQDCGITEMSEDPYVVTDSDFMLKVVEDSTPINYGQTAYHYLSFGWILNGLSKKVTGKLLSEFVEQRIACKIDGLKDEFMIGTSREDASTLILSAFMIPEQKKTAQGDANIKRPSFKPNLMMNPTFFNNPKIRSASIPSANGFFSAQALAKFYSAIVNENLFKGKNGILPQIESQPLSQSQSLKSDMVQGGEANFRLGFQVYGSDDNNILFIGHNGLGGSTAMTCINKKTGDKIQIAIVLNKLGMDAKITRSILRKIFNELKINAPAQLVRL